MLAKNSAIVFAALSINATTSFFFLVVMGRAMPLDDFGRFNAFMAVQILFSVPTGALILLYSRHATLFQAAGKLGELKRLYKNAWRVCLASAAVSAVIIVAGMAVSGRHAGISWLGEAVAESLMVGSFFLQAVQLAFVRGLQRFNLMNVGLSSAGIIKLALGAVLAWWGMATVSYAVLAIVVGVAFSIIAMHKALWLIIRRVPEAPTGLQAKPMLLYVISGTGGTIFPMLYMNIDMLMVRMLFPGEISGHYGAFTVVGKAVFLFGQVMGTVLFPAVVSADIMDAGSGDRLARRAMFILIGTGALLVAGVSLFAPVVLRVIVRSPDQQMAQLLPYYSLGILAVAVLFLEANHRLARQQYRFLWLAGIVAVLQTAGIAYFSGSIDAIVKFQALLFWCAAALRLATLFQEERKPLDAMADSA